MIIETIVTTVSPSGDPHFAAMGVLWGDDRLTIRPYLNTRTYRNLTASREAVVNVTDDVLLFVKSALTHEPLPSAPAPARARRRAPRRRSLARGGRRGHRGPRRRRDGPRS